MRKFLFIPGLPRCATTSFVQVLSQHPHIFLPKIKEPHFFLPNKEQLFMFDRNGNHIPFEKCGFINTAKSFNENYNNFIDDKVFLDASTLYAVHPASIDEIHDQKNIDPYFVILKRHPFKRALSHYLYSVARAEEYREFKTCLQDELDGKFRNWLLGGYIAGSAPNLCIERIINYWGEERLIIGDLDADEIFSSAFTNKVLDLLQLQPFSFNYNVQSNSLVVSSNKLFSEIRILLKKIRQINPLLIDNKFTRTVFNNFMQLAPADKTKINKYENDTNLKLFYMNAFQKFNYNKTLT
jgi:hypothetical protein